MITKGRPLLNDPNLRRPMLSLQMANDRKFDRIIIILMLGLWLCHSDSSSGQSPVSLNFSDISIPSALESSLSHSPDQPGYALILPGILGERFWDNNVQVGIRNSNFIGQTEIYDWTQGPLMLAANIGGSEKQSEILVQRIVDFKEQFPRRPLYLIGHSGGCRMVVQILEQLPTGVEIEKAVLLSPCMESTYNLSRALAKSKSGLVVFYSPLDLAISVPLTVAHGFVQARRIDQTGAATGFKLPANLTAEEFQLYQSRLVQKRFDRSMVWSGNVGGHFGWTMPRFVSKYVAPYLAPGN